MIGKITSFGECQHQHANRRGIAHQLVIVFVVAAIPAWNLGKGRRRPATQRRHEVAQ